MQDIHQTEKIQEHELIAGIYCLFQANPNVIAVGTLRDVQEIDVSHILSPEPVPWTDEESEAENGDSSRKTR